jgi:hypothetical protein
MDLEIDNLSRRIQKLESVPPLTAQKPANLKQQTNPIVQQTGDVSFAAISKFTIEPPVAPQQIGFVSLSRWEAG